MTIKQPRTGLSLALALALFGLAAPGWAANAAPVSAVPAATLDNEPPAIRSLIERANVLEADASVDTDESEWQAASLYCEASRLGTKVPGRGARRTHP